MALASGFKVNTNTSSLQTYRSYSKSQAGLEQNIERLSSGLRINRAADDTAGQAISQRMKNQATGMRQSVRNVHQATNYLQTAEGGLNEIHGILSRMRELAVQSASDNLTNNDRFSIELEYSQLKDEVSRIGNSTTYNNMKLIDGSRAKKTDSALNAIATVDGTVGEKAIKSASFTKTGTYSLAAINDHKMQLYFSAEAAIGADTVWSKVDEFVKAEGNIDQGNEIHFDKAGIVLQLDDDNYEFGAGGSFATGPGFNADFSETMITLQHTFTVDDSVFTTVQVGAYNDAGQAASVASVGDKVTENRITFNIADATSEGLGISTTGLSALGGAQSAINYLDSAIEKVNDERSNIGSLQNRFEFAASNLQSGIQNTDASRSSILDADFAVEAAGLAKNQILTQSGTAMLAQANQISQNILSLLK